MRRGKGGLREQTEIVDNVDKSVQNSIFPKKGKNGCAKLIHKTGDKMWIMWTTRKSNIYFVQLVWFTIKLAGWQKKKRFTWIGREAAFYSRFLCSCMEGLVLWLGFSGYGRFGLFQPGACAE